MVGADRAEMGMGYREADASEPQISGRRNGTSGRYADIRAESKGAVIGTSAQGAEPLYVGYQVLTASVVEDILVAAQQKGNRLFFNYVVWDLGHDLLDCQEYALAVECFRQISRSAAGFNDHFLIEAARVAGQLCVALDRGQLDGEESREVREMLRGSLIQLSHQEVDAATAALAAHTGGQASDVCYQPSDSPANRTTEAKAHSAPPLDARTTDRRAEPTINREILPHGAVTTSPHLEVRFFERFEIICRGRPLPLGHHGKALAILRYLVAKVPRPASQDYLMGWLWPESDLKKARWSLNSAVCALRKVLDGAAETPIASPIRVVLKKGYYRLSTNVRVYSDRDEFDVRYANGQQFEKDGRIREATAEYEKAIELYRGDFLVEDLYEGWTSIERERLVTAYIDMLKRLAAYYMRNG